MIASVSPEADQELTEGALFYAREGNAEVALAFIAEYERVLELLCIHPELSATWRNGRRRFRVAKSVWSSRSSTRPGIIPGRTALTAPDRRRIFSSTI
jgi:plasmid stabilization system protein ParE